MPHHSFRRVAVSSAWRSLAHCAWIHRDANDEPTSALIRTGKRRNDHDGGEPSKWLRPKYEQCDLFMGGSMKTSAERRFDDLEIIARLPLARHVSARAPFALLLHSSHLLASHFLLNNGHSPPLLDCIQLRLLALASPELDQKQILSPPHSRKIYAIFAADLCLIAPIWV